VNEQHDGNNFSSRYMQMMQAAAAAAAAMGANKMAGG
jgi:hypothetical protein